MADAAAPAPPFPIQTDWDGAPPALSGDHLQRYLAFIGVAIPSRPTLAAAAEVQLAHLRAIPFENLSPLFGEPVLLDHDALVAKLLSGTRGGYCFEHNMLFGGALAALGFDVQLLGARALIGLQPGEVRPRTHLVLLVTPPAGAPHLLDAGFGRTTLNGPLVPEPGLIQWLAGDRYRLVDHDGEWAVESSRGADGDWVALYLIDPRPVYPVDVEMANHFVATHSLSHMRSMLILLRPTAEGKRSVAYGELVVDETGRQERRRIAPGELAGLLRDEFGIEPPGPVDDGLLG